MRICCYCQRTIRGEARKRTPDSASGARPDVYAHHKGDPKCRPITDQDPADTH
ncbi:hypothetical protein [Streptomyces sp. NPDC086023]|uniref:hypothetical protein n=1 Tax=Streptomyces sp. NPDC086023 TaxID=3365746 RepID=UPI0037D41ED4